MPGLLPCPYCGYGLKAMPSRQSKCRPCKETIYIKRFSNETENRMMTAAMAEDAERARGERSPKLDYSELQRQSTEAWNRDIAEYRRRRFIQAIQIHPTVLLDYCDHAKHFAGSYSVTALPIYPPSKCEAVIAGENCICWWTPVLN